MATYRVYLRRKGSDKSSWQFSTTIVRANAAAAAQGAFEQWKEEKNSTAPAALSDCEQKVDERA